MTAAVPTATVPTPFASAETNSNCPSWRWTRMNRVLLEQKVLSENERLAAGLRERFRQHGVLCVNLISSPGSGKTTLLERTLAALPREARVAVLTGDIQTENDAARLKRFGFPVKQITTGGTCHLDAAEQNARRIHPGMEILRISCTQPNGLEAWLAWLENKRRLFLRAVQEVVAL